MSASHTIVVDESLEPQSVDPAFDYESTGWEVMLNVYEPLVFYENATILTHIVPLLATGWNSSADGLTYTFTLRQGVKFSDGTPFTAYAVWFSIYRALLMNQGPSWIISQSLSTSNVTAQMLNTMNFVNPNATEQLIMGKTSNSVQVVDPYTVTFHLTAPYAYFLATMTDPIAAPVSPTAVQANGGVNASATNAWMTYNSVGTGPYTITEWKRGDHITLGRNPYYWGPTPFLDGITIYYKSDSLSRILDLKSGVAQMAVIDPNLVSEVMNQTNITVQNFGPSAICEFVFMNTQAYPFNITSVRQAVVHGINYNSVIQSAYAGFATPYVGPIAAGMPHYNSTFQPYNYNPALSIQLLTNAGFQLTLANGTTVNPKGTPFPTVKFYYQTASATWTKASEIIQANLADIGIPVQLQGVSHPTYESLLGLGPTNPSYPQMAIYELIPDYISPDDYGYPLANIANQGIAGDFANYNNTLVNQMTSQAKYTLDPAQQQRLWDQTTQILYNDAPYAWIGQLDGYIAYTNNLRGVVWNPIFGFSGGGTLYKYITLSN